MSNMFLITMVISSQVTQQVYVAEDWVRSATTNLNAEIQNRYDIEKALGTANHEKTQIAEKLKVAKNGRKSAEARLKSSEAQVENQRKELYTTQLNLATEKTAVLDLQAKLKRAEKALKVAQEAATATETLAYERGVQETKRRLTAEVTAVCREYCAETYSQALDRAGIPADSNLRRTDQVYYLEDLKENPTPSPPPATIPLPPPNEPFLAQKSSQNSKLPIRFEKEEQEKEKEKAKEKEKEKEKKKEQNKADANPSEDALTIGDIVFKVKVAGSKSKIDSKKDSQQP